MAVRMADPDLAIRGSLRTRLRVETQDAHARVDALFGALDLTRRHDYARFLSAHEWAMRAVAGRVPTLPNTRRLLLQDLAALNAPPLDRPGTTLDGADPLGVAYVVAGAHFGAAVLRRRVLASSDPSIRLATRYLSSGLMRDHWRDVRERLEARPGSDKPGAAVVAGARNTFALFELALNLTHEEPS